MPDIFEYTDYRKFLADYYIEQKSILPAFSYQYFARKAGIPNKGFLYNVISGDRNISKSTAINLSRAIKFGTNEAAYFENLVSFNQAQELQERNYYFEKIMSIKSTRRGSGAIRETRKDQYEFYSHWYYSAVRSLLDMHDFKDNYVKLAKSLYPAIKPKEAKKAVQLLLKLGLIKKRKTGGYDIADKNITAGKEIVSLGLGNFQLQTNDLAKKSMTELPKEKRNVSGLTLGISLKTYQTICNEIEAFQEKILSLAEQDKEADNVYQLNFGFFPMSNVFGINDNHTQSVQKDQL